MNTKNKISKLIKSIFGSPKDIISFFLPIVIAIILIIPVPYYVTVGGGVIDIDDKIEIDNAYQSKGSLNSAYVKEMNGTVITYLLGKIIPSYELTKVSDVINDNETVDDYDFRERLYFTNSLDVAKKVAFTYLEKDVKIVDEKLYIAYLDDSSITDLKIKDQILKVNNIDVNSYDDVSDILKDYVLDDISLLVLRDGKEILCHAKLNNHKMGIYLIESYSYETDPQVNFLFSKKEAGPSGGLMLTLSIYNKLIPDDITKGYKIVGTGTISLDGSVGEIGGVKYKLMGAVKSKADIFIVPYDNYQEAEQVKKDNNYNIKIIPVKTFDDAVNKLKELD